VVQPVVASGREVTVPFPVEDPGPKRFSNGNGCVARSGIDDNDLIDNWLNGAKAPTEDTLFILDDEGGTEERRGGARCAQLMLLPVVLSADGRANAAGNLRSEVVDLSVAR
jgi:hypothetical protein